jgi:hypothetical protein
MFKKRFSKNMRSKLMPRGDGSFQILERINDNAYKVNLPSTIVLVLVAMSRSYKLITLASNTTHKIV